MTKTAGLTKRKPAKPITFNNNLNAASDKISDRLVIILGLQLKDSDVKIFALHPIWSNNIWSWVWFRIQTKILIFEF